MPQIVGVRFYPAGKIYYFDTSGIPVEINDYVVVETAYGKELGKVVITPAQTIVSQISEPLKRVIRKATPQDLKKAQRHQELAKEALERCRELVKKMQIPIKPILAHYDLDRTHLTIFFLPLKKGLIFANLSVNLAAC